jgi:hypothetical protein
MRLYAAAGSIEAPTDHVMFTFRLDGSATSGFPGNVAEAADADPSATADQRRE